GLFPFGSPLLRESIFLSLPLDTKMFQFSWCPSLTLCIHVRIIPRVIVLPHSDIRGSYTAYSSPQHICVCSVLHRLLVPRHPPCALHYFIVMKCVSVSFDTFAFSFLFVSNMISFFSLLYFYTVFNVQYFKKIWWRLAGSNR